MNEMSQNAKSFLSNLINDFGFDLQVSAEWSDEKGCILNLTGEDVSLVLRENGEMLAAFETLLFVVYGRELDKRHRFICDADGFKQARKSELHAMANFAAKSVREKGTPFTFGFLNSMERREIHLALKEEKDLLTESKGDGRNRRLQVKLK